MAELNIFGNFTYEDLIEEMRKQGKTPKELLEDERKGFTYNGMYVVGSTKQEFINLLEEVGWMKF